MNGQLPQGPAGRALAGAVTLLGLLLLWFGLVAPMLEWKAGLREQLDQQTAVVERMHRLSAAVPALKRQAEAAVAGHGGADSGLEGASDAVAAANLQQTLDDLAKGAGVRIGSAETLPAEAAGAWQAITVRITLVAPWPTLVHLLQSIAESATTMAVDNLQLRPPPHDARDPARPIDTAFSVTAWRLRDAKPL